MVDEDRTIRAGAQKMVERYEAAGLLQRAGEWRKILEWYDSDEVRMVYIYICEGHPLHNCIFERSENVQEWIDECLGSCLDCECGHIEETTMTGRDFGDLVMAEI